MGGSLHKFVYEAPNLLLILYKYPLITSVILKSKGIGFIPLSNDVLRFVKTFVCTRFLCIGKLPLVNLTTSLKSNSLK